jgi:hypothetical protein
MALAKQFLRAVRVLHRPAAGLCSRVKLQNTIRTRSGRTLILNTPEEEAAIQRGIEQDPDNPEWTAEDFKKTRRLGGSQAPDLRRRTGHQSWDGTRCEAKRPETVGVDDLARSSGGCTILGRSGLDWCCSVHLGSAQKLSYSGPRARDRQI